jgi:predicted transcriptional regulator of viral defense system
MEHDTTIQRLLDREHGVLMASTAAQAGLHRQQLVGLVKAGVLERAGWGVYIEAGGIGDELFSLQQRARKIVYSHETALFLHGMTDRTPSRYTITVPSSYKPSAALKALCDVYYIKGELIGLGKKEASSYFGHTVITYNLERTLCDIVRSRNKLDPQIVIDALKKYAARVDKDLNRLAVYAKTFGVSKIVHQYLEVLL